MNTVDFKKLHKSAHPVYTWLWNTKITKDGIAAQLDEMFSSGIRGFYVIGEPKNFRPERRRTHLEPEYLSDEYVELLYFAYEYAQGLGMEMWLYNEGGFPSGMVCGKIKELRPDLAYKDISTVTKTLDAFCPYSPDEKVLAAFAQGKRLKAGDSFTQKTDITEYRLCVPQGIRSDIASPENTKLFLELTHEKLLSRFGEHMGKDIRLMFDDEAFMGKWTAGYEKLFFEKYGYDVLEYLPFITAQEQPKNLREYRAVSDYVMLCGELVRDNYFTPMKKWLNHRGMLSAGHLDLDNFTNGCRRGRYGNILKTLREFDIPGIDMIWNQIAFPKDGKACLEGYQFFPRAASSAARQQGHGLALSESFAVCGAQLTPEDMRYAVNYQAVRGISIFNFMVTSYDRESVMCLQYRPNFISQNTGTDSLSQINTYTARLCGLLQKGSAEISTALYFPFRTICAGGELGETACKRFEELGELLEKRGVSFDLIDEDFVRSAKKENRALIGAHVRYDSIFVPEITDLEPTEIMEKLAGLGSDTVPVIERKNEHISARKIIMPNGDELYFICNLSGESASETVLIHSAKAAYTVDIQSGELYVAEHSREDGAIKLPLSLSRGEGVLVYLTDGKVTAMTKEKYEQFAELSEDRAYISREYYIPDNAPCPENRYFKPMEKPIRLGEWEKSFSGEATYEFTLPVLPDGNILVDLGEVRHFAKLYLNGDPLAKLTMPPYTARLDGAKSGDSLKIVVANTVANACASTKYFEIQDIRDVGPYHEKMSIWEKEAPAVRTSSKNQAI